MSHQWYESYNFVHHLIMDYISLNCTDHNYGIMISDLCHYRGSLTIWMLTVNVYIIVIYDVITVDYCKCILLYSPLNSYLYVHWILDFE